MVSTMKIAQNKAALKAYSESMTNMADSDSPDAADTFFSDVARINVVHPFNELAGPANYKQQVLVPLQQSFDLLSRNDYIVLGGEFEDGDWVACTGNYSGNFVAPFLDIKPTGGLAYLRFAEFHRMKSGKAVESYLFFDIPALMMAAGVWPIDDIVAVHRGYTAYIPGPSTGDGLQWQDNDKLYSGSTLDLTEVMLRNLATEDERWRPYWHNNMNWYGPAAFGAFRGIEEFANFQTPFEQTFTEWISGIMPGSRTRHFVRTADGNYSCLGGWPSLNCVQAKTFLGQPSKGERLYMRVCDFWRRDGDKLAENWVFVDIPHVLTQMGLELFPEAVS